MEVDANSEAEQRGFSVVVVVLWRAFRFPSETLNFVQEAAAEPEPAALTR